MGRKRKVYWDVIEKLRVIDEQLTTLFEERRKLKEVLSEEEKDSLLHDICKDGRPHYL